MPTLCLDALRQSHKETAMSSIPLWVWVVIAVAIVAAIAWYRAIEREAAQKRDIENSRLILLAFNYARKHNLNWDQTTNFVDGITAFVRRGTLDETRDFDAKMRAAFSDWRDKEYMRL